MSTSVRDVVSGVQPRVLLASLAAVIGAIVFRVGISGGDTVIYIPVVAMFAGAVVIHVRALGAQLLGRALFWSNFVLGAVLCFIGSRSQYGASLGLLLGCGVALVLADRRLLAAASDGRSARPAMYAGTIQLLMVLALADAQTSVLLGAIGRRGAPTLFFVAAAALVVGFVGLYRLALWGVIITMTTASLLALGMFSGVLWDTGDGGLPFGLVFALQVVAPLPMLHSMVTKRPLREGNPRLRSALATALVVVVSLVSVVACMMRAGVVMAQK